jgi:enamine deaminase RidA (YjgF/YER057c/UK114 family)
MRKRIINPWDWQDRYGFVQAAEVTGHREMLVCSGQTSNDSAGNVRHAGDMAAQIALAFDNVETVLQAGGWQLSDIVQAKYYTTDVDRFLAESGALMARLGTAGCRPASTLLGVSRLAFPELLVEIEVLAMR